METQPNTDPDSETLQALVARMARAKWITGTNCVNSEGWLVTYTELGRSRMRSLAEALRPFVPRSFGDRFSRPETRDMSVLLRCWQEIGAELQPPALSEDEIWVLAARASRDYLKGLLGTIEDTK